MEKDNYEKERPVVYLVGVGMGGWGQLTEEGAECLRQAEAVMGAGRILDSVKELAAGKPTLTSYRPSDMTAWLKSFRWAQAALVLSGDTGFYSGAEAAGRAFAREGWDVEYIPGISSLSYFCARLGKSWQDVHSFSLHGRDADAASNVRKYRSCFAILGEPGDAAKLCRELVAEGLGNVTVWAGENFSYEDERIAWEMTPAELIMEDEARPFGGLCCMLIENPQAGEDALYPEIWLEDGEFIRGGTPMTKAAVRRTVLEFLRIGRDAVCYDIGAGTGSVAVEMGRRIRSLCGDGQVYAIEKDGEALSLVEANRRKFLGSWPGFHLVEGEAPEAMEELETPTHAFIGGSAGRFREIVDWLVRANPQVRIAATAITLETAGEILSCMREYGFKEARMVQLAASEVQTVGSSHMLKGASPVFVAVMQGTDADWEEIEWQDV